MRLDTLAERIGCRLDGDPGLEVLRVRAPEDAEPPDVTFIADARHLPRLTASRAGAVIVAESAPPTDRPALRAANPSLALAHALAVLHAAERPEVGVHPTAVVADGSRVDAGASVGPLCVIASGAEIGAGTVLDAQVFVGANVRIGRDCRIYPHVTLREGTELGDRVTVHAGAVIGADGFGYAREGARHVKIRQIGRVVLGDDVEVGANATIDRATLGVTRVDRGTKIDNLVQIAHNVQIGEDTVIVSQVGIAGSTRVGSRVTIAGQVGIVDHLQIGDDVMIGAQSGVSKDIPSGTVMWGTPAAPQREMKRRLAAVARLPELTKAIRSVEERLRALEAGSQRPGGPGERGA